MEVTLHIVPRSVLYAPHWEARCGDIVAPILDSQGGPIEALQLLDRMMRARDANEVTELWKAANG